MKTLDELRKLDTIIKIGQMANESLRGVPGGRNEYDPEANAVFTQGQDRLAQATKQIAAQNKNPHPAGSHPVGAFLDKLFAHDRPTLDTGQEGFLSSVGATVGSVIRENALKLRTEQSSPTSVLADSGFNKKMGDLDAQYTAQNLQASVAPVSGASMTLGGVKNKTFENKKLQNEMIRQSILPSVEARYVGQDAVTGIMLEAKSKEQLKAYYRNKYPGVFGREDKELDAAADAAFPDEEPKGDKKSARIVPSKKTRLNTGLNDELAIKFFLDAEPDKEAAIEWLNSGK